MTKKFAPILTVLLIVVFGLVSSAVADEPGRELAERYGLSGWDQIEQIEFTFNVKLPNREVKRGWLWQIKTDTVTRYVDGDALIFHPSGINDASLPELKKVHKQFINDSYWLLFPFQLVWSDPAVSEVKIDLYPFAENGQHQVRKKLICQWPSEGGYTPGDAYDLYLNPDTGLIQQWVFRRGGQPEGNTHTWEDHQQLGPIIVSLDHHGPEGSGFRLWFTDIKATLVDGTVVTPQPIVEP